MRRVWSSLAAAFIPALAISCSTQEGASGAGPAAASTSARPRSSAAPPCSAGMRPGPSGGCVPNDAAAPEVTPGPSAPASARAPAGCPAATSVDKVAAYDWSKELGVDAPLATRLRGVSGAAAEAHLLAGRIEAEL